MAKAVLFDLDGTLLNRDKSLLLYVKDQYNRFEEHLKHINQEAFIQKFLELDQRGYVWKDKVYQQLVEDFSINSLSWKEFLHDYTTQFHFHSTPFPHVKHVLSVLKSNEVLLGIITNGYTDFQLRSIKALGIDPFMDVILISEQEGIKKPDRDIFLRALEKLKVSPEESLYVGDHPLNDVNGALNAGMNAIWMKDTYWNEAFTHEHVIENLLDLVPLVNKILIR